MNREQIIGLLDSVIHPETGNSIVAQGIVETVVITEQDVTVGLRFERERDPFQKSIRRQVTDLLQAALPDSTIRVTVTEGRKPKAEAQQPQFVSGTAGIDHIIAIASGKGGVGKSTVTANLALALRKMGYSVAILDADIYGPSQPKMFHTEGYQPSAENYDGVDYMVPAESAGVKIMSIGYFIMPSDALIWRGPMATNALKQLIHQTRWGDVDFLLVDLPPGTGDVHLSVVGELKVDGAVVVTTPQQVAVADVRRGIAMFRADKIDIPVLGLIDNMAWFTPAELPNNRYYIFGRGQAEQLADEQGVELLGEIPMVQSVSEGGDNGVPSFATDPEIAKIYTAIGRKIVDKLVEKG